MANREQGSWHPPLFSKSLLNSFEGVAVSSLFACAGPSIYIGQTGRAHGPCGFAGGRVSDAKFGARHLSSRVAPEWAPSGDFLDTRTRAARATTTVQMQI